MLDADVLRSGDRFENFANGFPGFEKLVEVVPEDFLGHITADPGDEFVEAHLDRLGESEPVPWRPV